VAKAAALGDCGVDVAVVTEALSLLLSCENLPPSKRGLGLAYSTGIVIRTHFDYRFRMEEEFAKLLFSLMFCQYSRASFAFALNK